MTRSAFLFKLKYDDIFKNEIHKKIKDAVKNVVDVYSLIDDLCDDTQESLKVIERLIDDKLIDEMFENEFRD